MTVAMLTILVSVCKNDGPCMTQYVDCITRHKPMSEVTAYVKCRKEESDRYNANMTWSYNEVAKDCEAKGMDQLGFECVERKNK